jgi:hypothetical protein
MQSWAPQARRRQDMIHPIERAAADEAHAALLEPGDRRANLFRQTIAKSRVSSSGCDLINDRTEFVSGPRYCIHCDMEEAAGKARIAHIIFVLALL